MSIGILFHANRREYRLIIQLNELLWSITTEINWRTELFGRPMQIYKIPQNRHNVRPSSRSKFPLTIQYRRIAGRNTFDRKLITSVFTASNDCTGLSCRWLSLRKQLANRFQSCLYNFNDRWNHTQTSRPSLPSGDRLTDYNFMQRMINACVSNLYSSIST